MSQVLSHLFISYSSVDGRDFAFQLHDTLEADNIPAWLDKRDLIKGRHWDTQLREAIRDCRAVLFVMTPDSVEEVSTCYDEWTQALKYKKHVVPLLVMPDIEAPFRLHQHQYLDFTGNFETAIASLRQHLRFMDSPAGELQRLKDQLADAKRRHRRARDASEERRIQDEIDRLTDEDIPRQQKLVDDPAAAAARTQKSIEAGLERERHPEIPQNAVVVRVRSRFVNPPPATAPGYFQDRMIETGQIARFLADDALRLITVVGRGGAGKTAVVCRLLKAAENGQLPDDGGAFAVDSIVYLSALSARRLEFPTLFADLSKLLPDDALQKLETVYKNPTATPDAKMRALLAEFTPEHFPHGRVVLLLDNFEDVTDPETRAIKDEELAEALKALLAAPPHPVRVIITTRVALSDLPTIQSGRQRRLDLDAGLESPYAEILLRELDADGALGLRDLAVESAQLREARERTRGIPRALEALYGILAADTSTTLDEVLGSIAANEAPETVTEALVGEAFSRLDITAQRVMGALAIFGRPVSPVAVDTLLQAHIPGIDSAPVLSRLVNMHFARKESGRFYLHPLDRAYALSRIPRGMEQDRPNLGILSLRKRKKRGNKGEGIFSQLALFHRAADYFASTRKPREEWKTLADLQPQLDEFDLRCEGGDWDTAADVLTDIDYDYLLLWGHYRLMANLHEQLGGKLTDSDLRSRSANSLGSAYASMGYATKAIPHFETALQAAQEEGDHGGEGAYLSNLGIVYDVLGQTPRAIEYYEQALKIGREMGDRNGEVIILGNLGEAYQALGQLIKAIEFLRRAVEINSEIGDVDTEGWCLSELGRAFLESGQYNDALTALLDSIRVLDEVDYPMRSTYANGLLALVHLRLNHIHKSRDAFQQAVHYADKALSRSAHAYEALYNKAFALGGLAVCDNNPAYTAQAIEAYRAARAITSAAGIVARALRLFDILAAADTQGVLAGVREAIAGE